MAKTQDIKRRIRSIQNTRKLTKAMKMVSAAKLRRAQQRVLSARPYTERTLALLRSLATRANPELSPLLQPRETSSVEVVVLTGDKGLCGSFNANIIREAEVFAACTGHEVSYLTIGKRGRDYFARREVSITKSYVDVFRDINFATAAELAEILTERYLEGQADEIHLVYNEFKSAIQSRAVVRQLLPVQPLEPDEQDTIEDYIYEPNAQQIFDKLLRHYVQQLVFHDRLPDVDDEPRPAGRDHDRDHRGRVGRRGAGISETDPDQELFRWAKSARSCKSSVPSSTSSSTRTTCHRSTTRYGFATTVRAVAWRWT